MVKSLKLKLEAKKRAREALKVIINEEEKMNKIQIERQYWVLRNRFVGLEKEHSACKAAINALNLENERLKQNVLNLETQKAELEKKITAKRSTRKSKSTKKSN